MTGPAVATPTPPRSATSGRGTPRRLAWVALGVFCVAFAGLEVVNHGVGAGVAAALFAAVPDVTRVVRGRDERYVRLLHSPWPPLAVLVGYTVTPLTWVPIFAAGLGWLAHVALARAVGCGLRSPGGRSPGGRQRG